MTRYIIQLYAYNGDQIYGKYVECDRKDIPRKLTSIGMDYLGTTHIPASFRPWSASAGTIPCT